MQNCFALSVLTPYTLNGGEWRQRQNGLYIDFSVDDFSVYTYVNSYDVFLTFIYMQIYMQALLKTPINHVSITALHLLNEKCCGKTLTILAIPLIIWASLEWYLRRVYHWLKNLQPVISGLHRTHKFYEKNSSQFSLSQIQWKERYLELDSASWSIRKTWIPVNDSGHLCVHIQMTSQVYIPAMDT